MNFFGGGACRHRAASRVILRQLPAGAGQHSGDNQPADLSGRRLRRVDQVLADESHRYHCLPRPQRAGGLCAKRRRCATFDAYPYLLHRGLNRRFPHAVINVIVTGIGGENSEQGAKRFKRDVLSLRPDVVTIDYALNDRAIGLARSERAWRKMIELALAHHVKVILLDADTAI